MKKRILSFVIAGLMVGLVSTSVMAEDAPGQQVQQIMEAMAADGITSPGIQAAVQANQELAAELIIAAAKAVNAADRPAIIAAGLGALPADKAAAVAKAVYRALPAEMQEDVLSGAIVAGLDPGPIGEAAAAGNPNPGNQAGNAGGDAGNAGGDAGATGGSGTGAGTGAAARSRGGSGRGRGFVSPS